jgi:hypothetical protein
MGGARVAAWLGIVLFVVSWFVPVHVALEASDQMASGLNEIEREMERALGNVADELEKSGEERPRIEISKSRPDVDIPFVHSGPPGWRAARFAFDLLTHADEKDGPGEVKASGGGAKRIVLGLTSLTNLVMLAAAIVLFARGSRGLGIALLVCAALNAGWVYLTDSDLREGLRVGYWLWLASFFLAGFGHLGASKE